MNLGHWAFKASCKFWNAHPPHFSEKCWHRGVTSSTDAEQRSLMARRYRPWDPAWAEGNIHTVAGNLWKPSQETLHKYTKRSNPGLIPTQWVHEGEPFNSGFKAVPIFSLGYSTCCICAHWKQTKKHMEKKNCPKLCQNYGRLLVWLITGCKWDCTVYKWGDMYFISGFTETPVSFFLNLSFFTERTTRFSFSPGRARA